MKREGGLTKYNTGFFTLARHSMATRDWLIWSVWFIWFIRLVWFNQINKTNHTNQIDQTDKSNQSLANPRGPFWIRHFKAVLLAAPPFQPFGRPLLTVLFGRRIPIMKLRFMSGQNPERLHR